MNTRPTRLDRAIDRATDHVLGGQAPGAVLVEYGSYACPHCHTAHQVVRELRDRFGEGLQYVFRHRPTQHEHSRYAAELSEVVAELTGEFWPVHDALMRSDANADRDALNAIAATFGVTEAAPEVWERARARVEADVQSARASGAQVSPTFFTGGRRYEGPWDASSLSEALFGSLGHRIHSASVEFASWGPATGGLLLLASLAAIGLMNSPFAAAFEGLWSTPVGWSLGFFSMTHPLHHWVNHGLLTVFFLLVGLEIKREFTVGRLSSRRAAALPVVAALGGMVVPALIYVLLAGGEGTGHGWGIPIATDTAFAIAIMVLLGARAPVELRVFLTAAVIIDDLAAIAIVALFYTEHIGVPQLLGAAGVTVALAALNRFGVYRSTPYAALGLLLWVLLHESGVHATLAGVLLALTIPARPPANLGALLAQAQVVLRGEQAIDAEEVLHSRPSDAAMRALDAIHDRIESPADKLMRTIEPWSSFVVLPLFAFANAGVAFSSQALVGHGALFAGIVLGLVVGKPLGMLSFAAAAVRMGMATKPDAYTWGQLAGAGALGGIGFTMSLFIAELAFDDVGIFTAAKLAIFAASILAGVLGAVVLWFAPAPVTD